jgi:tetratricopeptide (TPR) repeat protein
MTFGLSDHPFDGDSQLFMRWIGRARTAVPQGLVLRLYRRGEVVSDAEALRKSAAIWRTVRLPDPAAVRMDQDLLPDLVVGHYTWMLVNFGQLQERAGRYAEAEATYTQALELAPDPEGAGGQAAAALQALRRRGVNGSVRLDTGGSGQNGSPAGLSTAQTTLARQAAQ